MNEFFLVIIIYLFWKDWEVCLQAKVISEVSKCAREVMISFCVLRKQQSPVNYKITEDTLIGELSRENLSWIDLFSCERFKITHSRKFIILNSYELSSILHFVTIRRQKNSYYLGSFRKSLHFQFAKVYPKISRKLRKFLWQKFFRLKYWI